MSSYPIPFVTEPQGMQRYAAPSLFQPHRARQAIRDAHEKKIPPLICYYGAICTPQITRFVAPMGYDAVWIDWEHSPCNVETMTEMVHQTAFMSQGKTIPWVRVPGHDHAAIGYALDAGASIVIPQVDTVEQAQHVISAAKFGSKQRGTRSAPPFRLLPFLTDTAYDGSGDFHKAVNNQAAIMIQIESLAGINNLDDILTQVPDIDCVWLGSLDARVSMNFSANMGMGGDEKEWTDAVAKFHATLKKHDMPYAGMAFASPPFGSAEKFKKSITNMAFATVTGDVVKLMGLVGDLEEARKLTDEALGEHKAQNGTSAPVPNGN